jgi:hypothetical protein
MTFKIGDLQDGRASFYEGDYDTRQEAMVAAFQSSRMTIDIIGVWDGQELVALIQEGEIAESVTERLRLMADVIEFLFGQMSPSHARAQERWLGDHHAVLVNTIRDVLAERTPS